MIVSFNIALYQSQLRMSGKVVACKDNISITTTTSVFSIYSQSCMVSTS